MEDMSVIIPAYNAAKTIESTLQSIVDQTVQPREIIVVDDGSTDNTADVVRKYPQVTYVKQANSGASHARNNGVALSTSTWIAFCDADDVWHPSKMSICLQAIQEYPTYHFIFHDFYIFDSLKIITESGTLTKDTLFPIFLENRITIRDILKQSNTLNLRNGEYTNKERVEVLSGSAFEGLILGNIVIPSTVLMRLDKFMDAKGFDCNYPPAEDTEFFLRLSKSMEFMFINLPLTGYKKAPGSITRSNKLSVLQNSLKALIKNCVEDEEVWDKWRDTIRKSLSQRYSRIGYYYLSEFRRSDAMLSSLRSLRYNQLDKRAWFCLFGGMMPLFLLKYIASIKASMRKSDGR